MPEIKTVHEMLIFANRLLSVMCTIPDNMEISITLGDKEYNDFITSTGGSATFKDMPEFVYRSIVGIQFRIIHKSDI